MQPLEIELFEAFEFLIYPKRVKVPFGGRGGAKSEEIAELLVWFAWQHGDKVLCGREFQNSMDESSYALIVSKIDKFGLRGFFNIRQLPSMAATARCSSSSAYLAISHRSNPSLAIRKYG